MTNPFGIYVHIPFCVHRCSYCDFYSFTRYGASDFERLTARIEGELREAADWLRAAGRTVPEAGSIFFGGGTPSLLPTPLLGRIFRAIGDGFAIARDAEITLEANPETVSEAFCEGLRAETPVNRVSLGAQSFQPRYLKKLERLGSPDSIGVAMSRLRASGLDNLSLDLIFAIPGQDPGEMRDDIARAAALGPRHLSAYNLTLKPGHPLFSELPDDDACADLYEEGVRLLAELGYAQYEISNYARPGAESRHNQLYWNGGDYLGVGPSAASRFFWGGRFHHRKQIADFRRYLEGAPFPTPPFEASAWEQTVLEASFLELRTNRGVQAEAFRRRYGYDLRSAAKYGLFRREGLLEERDGWLKLSARGRLLADMVTADLVDVG